MVTEEITKTISRGLNLKRNENPWLLRETVEKKTTEFTEFEYFIDDFAKIPLPSKILYRIDIDVKLHFFKCRCCRSSRTLKIYTISCDKSGSSTIQYAFESVYGFLCANVCINVSIFKGAIKLNI